MLLLVIIVVLDAHEVVAIIIHEHLVVLELVSCRILD